MVNIKKNHLAFRFLIFVFIRFAPSTASTISEPGVNIAAMIVADNFIFLTILAVMFVATGYLIAPHD